MADRETKTLQKTIFEYLYKNLDNSIKKKLSGIETRELIKCIADWSYQERIRCSFEVANNVRKAIEGRSDGKEEIGADDGFLDELDKL